MADETGLDSSSSSSGSGAIGMWIFIIFVIILIGERIDGNEPQGIQTPEEGVANIDPNSGDYIADSLGIYNPQDVLRDKLQGGNSLIPINTGPLATGPNQIAQGSFGIPEGSDFDSLPEAEDAEAAVGEREVKPDIPEYTMKKPFFGIGNIEVGKNIIMTTDMRVRKSPAGVVIGEQLKRAKGVVKAGPEDLAGFTWWAIDFEDAPDGWVPEGSFTAKTGLYSFLYFWPVFFGTLRWIAVFLIGLLLIGMLWVNKKKARSEKIRGKKKDVELSYKEQKKLDQFEAQPIINEKWQQVGLYMQSNNHTDWRQAILEADIMLDEMLTKIGYAGQSVGEKLKNVEESDFVTLQKAWEAHKVRNRIAHGGATEVRLDRMEAERVIGLYEQVFKEFYYI